MKPALFTAIFILAGVASFYYAAREGYRNYILLSNGQQFEGRVTGYIGHSNRDDKSVPIIKFVDAAGKEHRIESRATTSFTDYQAGDKVPVLYDEQTGRIRIATFLGLYFGIIVLVVLGSVAWSPFIFMIAVYFAQKLGWIDAYSIEQKVQEYAKRR